MTISDMLEMDADVLLLPLKAAVVVLYLNLVAVALVSLVPGIQSRSYS